MKKYKKILVWVTVFALMCGIVGCGSEPRNIEDEVSSALNELADEAKAKAEEENPPEAEPALDHLDIEEPDVAKMTDSELNSVKMEQSTADHTGNVESTVAPEKFDDGEPLQIVLFGDSIFDSVRDETGIARIVGESLEADVYNLSIGGTTAGLRTDKSTDKATWNEPNFLGVLYTMQGEITNGLLDGYKSGEVMSTLDPSKTDYFIIEYGTNDFLWYIPLGAADYKGQYYFYYRTSLDLGIELLQRNYPDAKIILCTPYYEEFWSADRTRYIGDAHMTNNGFGTLMDYISVAKDAARAHNVPYLDMYDLMGIDIYNINDMTVDGIHPSAVARQKYAGLLVDTINAMEEGGTGPAIGPVANPVTNSENGANTTDGTVTSDGTT